MTTPTPDTSPEAIKASYGFVGQLANAIPEINDLLTQAVSQNWTPDRFIMSVASTNWWKNTDEGMRAWITKQAVDPASAQAEMDTGIALIKHIGTTLGLPMDSAHFEDSWLGSVWLSAKTQNLTGDELNGFVYDKIKSIPEGTMSAGGKLGQLHNGMLQMAFDYGYNPDDLMTEINDAADTVMSAGAVSGIGGSVGAANLEGWRTKMMNYAQAKYAPFADQIQGGRTVKDIAQPYLDSASKLLELAPSAVTLSDPLLDKALTQAGSDGKPVSLTDFNQQVRSDSRWDTTNNAKDNAASMMQQIGKDWGFIGKGVQ